MNGKDLIEQYRKAVSSRKINKAWQDMLKRAEENSHRLKQMENNIEWDKCHESGNSNLHYFGL